MGVPPFREPDPTGAEAPRESLLTSAAVAVGVAAPWLFAIYAGFDIYIYVAYPHASLDRLGPAILLMFVLAVAAPLAVGLGFSKRLRRRMCIVGLLIALLLGLVAGAGHLLFGWH